MCTKTLSCILCGQPNFHSIDALRVSLLKVTARPLKCPICGDELLGLDKLTIHLFGHSLLEDRQSAPGEEQNSKNDIKRNTSNVSGSLNNLRKVRRKESSDAELERSGKGSDIGLVKMSSAAENSTCFSNAHYCPECDVEFRNPALLEMHREVFHASNSVSTGAAGGSDDTNKRFVCHICPKEFKMKGSLKIHMRVVHADRVKKLCLEGAKRTTIVQSDDTSSSTPSPSVSSATHETVVRSDVIGVKSDIIPPMISMQILDQQQNIAVFQSQVPTMDGTTASAESHIIQIIDPRQLAQVVYLPPSSAEENCGNNSDTFACQKFAQECTAGQQRIESISLPSSPLQHVQHDSPKQWECDVCRKSFTTKYFLKKHNRLHTGEMPYTCAICSKSFTFQQSYHKHLLYHSDEKPHACSVCNRAFKELSTLHNHQRIHSGEKPFACETCGKCFRQRVSYLVHRRIHTGLMPYKCSGCDKSFRYKVSQRTHKCPASPPGTVVRKTGDLLQKLLQSSSILPERSSQQDTETLFTASPTIGDQTGASLMVHEHKQTADYVDRTLEELVRISNDKLDIRDNSSASTMYDHHLDQQQLYVDSVIANQFKQPHQPQPLQQQQHPVALSPSSEASFPRIENLCLFSPSAFDGGQLEDLEGLKLDNGW